MAAMTNAQRQKRWRERHKTGDLFPPVTASAGQVRAKPVTANADQVRAKPVTPSFTASVTIPSYFVTSTDGILCWVLGCPFCGQPPRVVKMIFGPDHGVDCPSCRLRSPYAMEHSCRHALLPDILALWNTRNGLLWSPPASFRACGAVGEGDHA